MSIFKGTSEPKSIKIGIPHDDYSAMQGPAPDGFHIPLSTERQTVNSMGVSLGAWTSSGYTDISNYLKLPLAGVRGYSDGSVSAQGSAGYYWCSDASGGKAYHLLFNSYGIFDGNTTYKCISHSIRAFKNTPVIPDSSWTVLYQGTGTSGIYHNSTLGLISISSDGQTWETIADKNIGASQLNDYGYTYQRGNNNGFGWGSVTISSTQVNASTYGPGNYYSSSTFITSSSSPYDRSSVQNDNLRGGVTGMVQKADTDIKKVYLGSTQVRPRPPRTFTISWTEKSNMSSGWTYSDDAAGLTAGSGDFDDFFGYSAVLLNTSGVETAEMTQSGGVFTGAMTTLGNITSGDNVMIKFPVRGIKMTKSGSVVTLSITEELNKTGYQYYAFQNGTLSNPGTAKDAFYLGVYKGCLANPRLKSWSGRRPIMYETQATFCTYAKANGSGYNIEGFYQRMYVNALYMMKYGNPNSRSRIGNGYIGGSSAQYTGGTNSITNATGATSTSTTGRIKLFGLEDRWGNIGEEIGGAYSTYKNGGTHIFVTLNNWSGQASGGEDTGTVVYYDYNNMSAIAGDNKTMFMSIAGVSNSNYDTYYSALSYTSSDNRMPLAGYWYNAGSSAGALTMTFNYASSQYDERWGTRLMYLNGLT